MLPRLSKVYAREFVAMKDMYPTLTVFKDIELLSKTLVHIQNEISKTKKQIVECKQKNNVTHNDLIQCYNLPHDFRKVAHAISLLSKNDLKKLLIEIEIDYKWIYYSKIYKLGLTDSDFHMFREWCILNPNGSNLLLNVLKVYANDTPKQVVLSHYFTKLKTMQSDVSKNRYNLWKHVKYSLEDSILESQIRAGTLTLSELATRYKEMEDFSFLRDPFRKRSLESAAKSLMIDPSGEEWIMQYGDKSENCTSCTMHYILTHGWHKYVQLSFIERGIGWNTMSLNDAEYFNHPECIHYVSQR
jgi:hypothetical protein